MIRLFRHKKLVLLALFISLISFAIAAVSIFAFYGNAQKQLYNRLQDIVNREKAGIAVLENKLDLNENDITEYLEQVRYKDNSIGENGDIILFQMINDSIQFMISDKLARKYPGIPKSDAIATPMRKALNGESGYMRGLDYNGVEVFSAYTFIEKLNCGVVAKIPTSEINKPFLEVIFWIFISLILLVLIFVCFFLKITNPIIDSVVLNKKELIMANKELVFQNDEKEKRAEELDASNLELKKANSELDRFVYSASHDLRSPLKSLLGLSNMIIEDISPDNSVQLEQMGMMKSSILKLDNFIEDILTYSRNARTEVINEAIDFKQTIGEVRNNLAHMDGADKIELKLEIDQKIEFISDRARVSIVLSNLISNAIKYKDTSKENSYIGINVKCINDFATISVEDNGIGIDAKYKDRIFDMFYRGTKKSSGSGLGLYIAKEAIEKLNGTMEMESALTQGTKFTIMIPNRLVAST